MKIPKSIYSRITRISPYGDVLAHCPHTESHYNENGHQTSFILFDDAGEIENKSIFEVDHAGNILTQMHYERTNALIERTEFHDDEEGVQYKTEITTHDGHKTIHEYEYNQIGNTDRITIRDEAGHVEAFEFFRYNEAGQVTEEIRTDDQQSVQFRRSIQYNSLGLPEKESYYNHTQTLQRTITYHYNEKGWLTEKKDHHHEFDTQQISHYTHDLAGNQILDETYTNGKIIFKNECEFDDQNQLIREHIIHLGQENYIETIDYTIEYHPETK